MPNGLRHSNGDKPSPEDGSDRLREARRRFIAAFPPQCDSVAEILKAIAAHGPKGFAEPLRRVAHETSALAGTVGFPNVSERASELEMLAAQADKGFNLDQARGLLEALRETFSRELAFPPAWAAAPPQSAIPVIVADASDSERQLIVDYLQLAGYSPVAVASGGDVLDAVREYRPGAVLLEPNLPGIDGYGVCRLLKSDTELARIPVIFVTVRENLEDKVAGLTLGADDYLLKPIDPHELLMHLEMFLRRRPPA